ncbi:hypothetical protein [Kosakonia cowanii]|uniref:hypothetical protein n=1 Tax=Kosakonia cowanii TaxID=208223 RepID=UPI0012EC2902|nr:hypothetical protein [Kosakonia cowanii]
MAKKFEKTIPGHQYKIGLGVIQAEKMGKAASKVNETPRDFLKKSALDNAQALIDSAKIGND